MLPEQLQVVIGLDEDELGVDEVGKDARVVVEVGAHDDSAPVRLIANGNGEAEGRDVRRVRHLDRRHAKVAGVEGGGLERVQSRPLVPLVRLVPLAQLPKDAGVGQDPGVFKRTRGASCST